MLKNELAKAQTILGISRRPYHYRIARKTGFASIQIILLLVVVVGVISYVGYRVAHKEVSNSVNSALSLRGTKFTGQSAVNGIPLANSQPPAQTNTNAPTTGNNTATTTHTPSTQKPPSNTPPPKNPSDPVPSYIKGFVYLTTTGGANCGNHCTQPTPQPYQATVMVETTTGSAVTSFTSAADGSFSVTLAAGTYLLVPDQYAGGAINAQNQTVTVAQGGTANITINYQASTP